MEKHVCTNCGNEFTAFYCNNCGQKITHRISIAHLGHDLVHAFIHADKGIILLFVDLFRKPGIVAREFIIEGKRKKYFNPIQYLLLAASIATFVVVGTHFMDQYMQTNPFNEPAASARQSRFMHQYLIVLTRYFNIVLILQIPFFAAGSRLVYMKYKLNYAEHLTLHTFISAQVSLLTTIIMLLAMWLAPKFYILPQIIVAITYYLITFLQFFHEQSFKGGLRALMAYILGLLFYMIFIILVLAISVIVFIKMTGKS